MTDLTDDEKTVLLIAAEGQSIAAIAKWEKPIESLVVRGLMQRGDKFNNFITSAGRVTIAEAEKQDDEAYRQILERGRNLTNQHEQVRQSVEQAATHLMFAARASCLATGDTPQAAVEKWMPEIHKRALELLAQS